MNNSTTFYCEIVEILCAEIREGKYAKERSFPSLTNIMHRFGCSRGTAVKSVEELKRRGVVKTVSGSGIFVTRRGSANKIGLIVPGVAVTDFFKPCHINQLIIRCIKFYF